MLHVIMATSRSIIALNEETQKTSCTRCFATKLCEEKDAEATQKSFRLLLYGDDFFERDELRKLPGLDFAQV